MMIASSEMQAIASEILLALGPSYSRAAYDVSSNREWWNYLPKGGDPRNFDSASEYFKSAIASDLWKKFQDFPGDKEAREKAAFEKWLSSEKQCYRTNQRFDDYIRGSDRYLALDPQLVRFLDELKKDVAHVLGRVPSKLKPRWGKGATYETRGAAECVVPSKISTIPTRTPLAKIFEADWRATLWGRNCSTLRPFENQVCVGPVDDISSYNAEAFADWGIFPDLPLVRGNRYDVVPKNRDIDRSIAIEPALNVSYQLAFGSYLKERLRMFGQLLKPQYDWLDRRLGKDSQELHRQLARLASIFDDLATIDLSAASDTVAYAFVEWCLPAEWFYLLKSLRCPTTEVNGISYHLEKFSSMGCGFTFELETLLFFCISRVTLRMLGQSTRSIHVFGDDIIVQADCYRSIIASLRFCGFTPNASKSFAAGPFRESCGGDFFRGEYVRAPNISGAPQTVADWVVIHNQLHRLEGSVDSYHLGQAKKICLDNIPRSLRLYGPEVLGDVVLHGPKTRWKMAMRRYMAHDKNYKTSSPCQHIKCIKAIPQSRPWSRWDTYTEASSRICGCNGPNVPLRGEPESFSTQWVPLTAGYAELIH